MYEESEEDRLEHLQIMKSRGKGAPKKKKTATGKWTSFEWKCQEAYGLTNAQRVERRVGRRSKGLRAS